MNLPELLHPSIYINIEAERLPPTEGSDDIPVKRLPLFKVSDDG